MEESPLDILLVSGHGTLLDSKHEVPSNSVYIYDAHCGKSSIGIKLDNEFFKKRISENARYLSSWILNTTGNKLGSAHVLVKRPGEEYYDSSLSLILDFRNIDGKQEFDLIDECDKIIVQKSGVYSYNELKASGKEHKVNERVVLDYAYINEKGKMKKLTYDEELKTYKGARKKLLRRQPDADPFYIITKKDVFDIYENSIYPTYEDIELLFDEGDDYMRYSDFCESIDMYEKTVSDFFDSYKNAIIVVPSCRGNEEIDVVRLQDMQHDSLENVENRLLMGNRSDYFSSSAKSSAIHSNSDGDGFNPEEKKSRKSKKNRWTKDKSAKRDKSKSHLFSRRRRRSGRRSRREHRFDSVK